MIEVADIDAESEEELDDIETPDVQRRNRWRRVAQAATKQCLRLDLQHARLLGTVTFQPCRPLRIPASDCHAMQC